MSAIIPKKLIHPWRDGIFVALCTLVVTVSCSSYMYYYASRGLLTDIQETLFHIARTAAIMTDGDLHQTLTDNSQKNGETYQKIQAPYHQILKANPDIRYIYTVVARGNKAYFIIDTQQPSGAEELPADERKTTADIMEEYVDIPPTMKKALLGRMEIAEDSVYQDEWGTFISAYVPIYTSDKRYIGIVGADIDARNFISRMNAIRIPYYFGLLFALGFSIFIGLLVRHIRAGHARRMEERRLRMEAMEKFHLDMLAAMKDVATISFKIDGKTAQIAGMAQTSTEKTMLATRTIQGSGERIQAIRDAADRLLQVVIQLSETLEQYGHSLKNKIGAMSEGNGQIDLRTIHEQIDRITGQARGVIGEQQHIVGDINEDIGEVMQRAEEIIATVRQIAEMASEISTKTMHMHKDVHMLYEKNLSLSNEVEAFVQSI